MIKLDDLTEDQKEKLLEEMVNNLNTTTKVGLFHITCLQMDRIAAETNAKEMKTSTEATFGEKRYFVETITTIEEITK